MKKLLIIVILAPALFLCSCIPICMEVTGPNDISYTSISAPSCASRPYDNITGDFLINSGVDFDAYCSGGTAPGTWDFINKTYILIRHWTGAPMPYLAGVGNDPADGSKILVTFGVPCSYGMVPASVELQTYCLEINKTAKTLRVETKKESRFY